MLSLKFHLLEEAHCLRLERNVDLKPCLSISYCVTLRRPFHSLCLSFLM